MAFRKITGKDGREALLDTTGNIFYLTGEQGCFEVEKYRKKIFDKQAVNDAAQDAYRAKIYAPYDLPAVPEPKRKLNDQLLEKEDFFFVLTGISPKQVTNRGQSMGKLLVCEEDIEIYEEICSDLEGFLEKKRQ